jgi:protein arginine kinase activator
MLCERCKKNEATFYYHENINGKQKTYRLCGDCEAELEKSGELKEIDTGKMFDGFDSFLENPFNEMHSLLASMFGDNDTKQLKSADAKENTEKKCPACGTTFREFAENGMAGCPTCYETFADELKPTLGKVHGHTSHIGRAPARFKEKLDAKKHIAELEAEQKEAVKNEDFEKAAQIRDELKELRNTL